MKKTLYLLMFTIAYVQISAQVPTASLVAWWPFDGNAADLSGNANNGTMTNVTPAQDRFGNPNRALYFNGINSKIVVPHSPSIDMNSTDFTISFWEKSCGGNVDRDILEKQMAGTWNGYGFTAGNVSDPGYCTMPRHVYFYTASAATQDACTNDSILYDSTWHCVTGVFKTLLNKSYLYIDGVLQSDIGSSSGPTSNAINLGIGFCLSYNSRFFHGALDDIRIYKRALSTPEIGKLCEDKSDPLGVQEMVMVNNRFVLYPNPGNGDFVVRLYGKSATAKIVVLDQCGKEVYASAVADNETIHTGLATGIYMARIVQDGERLENYKLVINK